MLLSLLYLFPLTLFVSWLVNAESPSAFTDTSRCPHQPHKIHIFSRRPLTIYIEDFVSTDEATQLIKLAEPLYAPSKVIGPYDSTSVTNTTYRLSDTTLLYNDDPLINCIMERAASFQGIPTGRLEPLQVVRYPLNGYFKHHYDWFSQDESNSAESCVGDYYCDQMGNRESTFFVYLTGEEEGVGGGETEFPYLEVPESINKKWCEFLDCDAGRIEKGVDESELNGGVRWKPKAGNAVFWENLDGDGRGIEEVLHAGLSVTGGTKIGMNIWTREQEIRVVEFCGM